MSEPVTNAEVEDVLSSIRRLVSEDKRPLQAQPKPVVSDRLVLTPALRVADEDSDHGAEASASEAEDWSEDDASAQDLDGDDFAEDELTEEAFFAPEADEAPTSAVRSGAHTNPESPASFPEDDDDFDDPARDYGSDPYNFDDETDEDGEGRYVEPDPLITQAQDALAAERTKADQAAESAYPPAEQGDSKAARLGAKIEALETAIGKIADTWEPDSPGADEYSGTEPPAMDWEDDLEEDEGPRARLHNLHPKHPADANVAGNLHDKVETEIAEDTPEEEDSFALPGDDQLLDEEALRDLVSEIVRSELQGALGERITRNVRKLVRREIHRALTAQELE